MWLLPEVTQLGHLMSVLWKWNEAEGDKGRSWDFLSFSVLIGAVLLEGMLV